MSIDIDHLLVETATRYEVTKNEYGDINYGATSSEACLYRDISTLNQVANRNEVSIDGILWLGAASPAVKGDIYYHASEGYLKLMKRIKAKTLVTDDVTKFLKFEVAKQRQVS